MKKVLKGLLGLLIVSGCLQAMEGGEEETRMFKVKLIIDNQTNKVIESKKGGLGTTLQPGMKSTSISSKLESPYSVITDLLIDDEKSGYIKVSFFPGSLVAVFQGPEKDITKKEKISIFGGIPNVSPSNFEIEAQVLVTLKGDDLSESTIKIKDFKTKSFSAKTSGGGTINIGGISYTNR